LASVLLLKPKLFVADEPTTALDTLSQREVLELMVELAHDNGSGSTADHARPRVVARYTERAIVLEKGRLMESGSTEQILAHPRNPYTSGWWPRYRTAGGISRRRPTRPPRCSRCARLVSNIRGGLASGAQVNPKRGAWRDLQVRAGEIVAIVGASAPGSRRWAVPFWGSNHWLRVAIRFDGIDLAAMTAAQRKQFRREAQLVFQDPYSSLDPRRRVRDIVAATLRHVETSRRPRGAHASRQSWKKSGWGLSATGFHTRCQADSASEWPLREPWSHGPGWLLQTSGLTLDVTIQQQILTLFQTLQGQYGFACCLSLTTWRSCGRLPPGWWSCPGAWWSKEGPVASVFGDPAHKYTRALLTPHRPCHARKFISRQIVFVSSKNTI